MITVVRNVKVYSPEYLGEKTVVLVGDKFEGVYDNIEIPSNFLSIKEVNGKGKLMFPGFIDGHVHIAGGGGETGFSSRTPEIKFSDLIKAGITTVVGCLGTDGICRNLRELLAKAKKLEYEGISTYCFTGSYELSANTITGKIKEDIMLIDKFIGLGEIAISDNRSSQPTYEMLLMAIAEARVGGLLSGKSGLVNIHLGSGKGGLRHIFEIIKNTEIPPTQILPTHINRHIDLFNEGLKYVELGGYIDLTTSCDPIHLEPGEITASKALKKYIEMNYPIEHITFTSDGNGSIPQFNEAGEYLGLGICSVNSLYKEVRKAILKENIPIEKALKVITSNIADLYKLNKKGRIKVDNDGDFVLVRERDLEITDVYAKGKSLIENNKVIVKGIFEEYI